MIAFLNLLLVEKLFQFAVESIDPTAALLSFTTHAVSLERDAALIPEREGEKFRRPPPEHGSADNYAERKNY